MCKGMGHDQSVTNEQTKSKEFGHLLNGVNLRNSRVMNHKALHSDGRWYSKADD